MHLANIEKIFWAPVSFKQYQNMFECGSHVVFFSSPYFCLIDKSQVFGLKTKSQKGFSLLISGSNTYSLSQVR